VQEQLKIVDRARLERGESDAERLDVSILGLGQNRPDAALIGDTVDTSGTHRPPGPAKTSALLAEIDAERGENDDRGCSSHQHPP
jgi:hypothetical protein